jgi:hypothetical protein
MRRAKPDELTTEAFAVLTVEVSEPEFKKLFPVDMEEIDPHAEPEPSVGALVQLQSGPYVVVIYGKESHTMKVLVPDGTDPIKGIEQVLAEVPIPKRRILWRYERKRVPRQRGEEFTGG